MALSRDPETLKIPAYLRRRSLASAARKKLVITALDRQQKAETQGMQTALNRKKRLKEKIQTRLRFETPRAVPQKRKIMTAAPDTPKISKTHKALRTPIEAAPSRLPAVLGRRLQKRSPQKARTAQAHARELRRVPHVPLWRHADSIARRQAHAAKLRRVSQQAVATEVFSAPLLESAYEVRPGKLREKMIGTITHYYAKIKVGVIALSGTLEVGDTIEYFTENDDSFQEVVSSMEIDRQPVFTATKGQEIGIKLKRMPTLGQKVLIVR